MYLRVLLIESEEGFAAFCPALPGCVSQGKTEADALSSLQEAAALWLEAGGTPLPDGGVAQEAELREEAAAESFRISTKSLDLALVA